MKQLQLSNTKLTKCNTFTLLISHHLSLHSFPFIICYNLFCHLHWAFHLSCVSVWAQESSTGCFWHSITSCCHLYHHDRSHFTKHRGFVCCSFCTLSVFLYFVSFKHWPIFRFYHEWLSRYHWHSCDSKVKLRTTPVCSSISYKFTQIFCKIDLSETASQCWWAANTIITYREFAHR